MAGGSVGGGLFQDFGRLFTHGTSAGLSEGELLDRSIARGDDLALGALVERHGSMVLKVCRNLLDDPNDVSDAFQATFLVLVKRADSLRRHDQLGGWLYGVALRVARRARAESCKRKSRQVPLDPEGPADLDGSRAEAEVQLAELRAVLHDELGRLPQTYREAVVLCWLEGRTHDEAARRLGWPIGTVKGRLSRAGELLRDRLKRRGLTASTASIIALLASQVDAALPAGWVELVSTTAIAQSGRSLVATVSAGLVSAQAVVLSKGVLRAMSLSQIKLAATACAAVGIALGTGFYAQGQGGSSPQPRPSASVAGQKPGDSASTKATGPALPAVFPPIADERIAVSRRGLEAATKSYKEGNAKIATMSTWSRRLLNAQLTADHSSQGSLKALEEFVARSEKYLDAERKMSASGNGTLLEVAEAEYDLADAKLRLSALKTQAESSSAQFGGMGMGMGMGGGGPMPGGAGRSGMPGMGGGMGGPGGMGMGMGEGPMPGGAGRSGMPGMGGGMGMGGGIGGRPGGGPVAMAGGMPGIPSGGSGMMAGEGGGGFGGGSGGGSGGAVFEGGGGLSDSRRKPAPHKPNPADDSLNKAINDLLEQPIPLKFPTETPLEEVLKYVKEHLKGKDGKSVPIYVDPRALEVEEKTMTSPITIDIEGVPLRTTLRLALAQIDLVYRVEDGVLMIGARPDED